MGSNEWYYNLASPNSVKQNLWTLAPSTKWCAFIQLLVQSRWTSASSSGFHEHSSLKWDHFRCIICCPCWAGCACCSCCCGACCPAWAWAWAGGSGGAGIPYTCSPGSAISYLFLSYLSWVALYSSLLSSHVCISILYSYPLLLFYYCY